MKKMMSALIVVIAAQAGAEPIVIKDLGGRETGLKSSKELLGAAVKNTPVPTGSLYPGLSARYPIESSLEVGIIEPYAHGKNVTRPFFIVGFDQHSARWLAQNADHLKTINAQGFVTNIQSQMQLEKLRSYASELQLNALPVDDIAQQFDLIFYPVLITQEEITQ